MEIDYMLQGNERFARSRKWKKERKSLVDGQHPRVIVVCCSDSRVSPEIIFQRHGKLGEMYVVRTAGHVLDASALESIQFAIDKLSCDTIIVVGHQNCGAVTAIWEHYNNASNFAIDSSCSSKLPSTTTKSNSWPYKRIEKYIASNLLNNPLTTKKENIEASIKLNSLRTADLIAKKMGLKDKIPNMVLCATYYHIDDGHIDIL